MLALVALVILALAPAGASAADAPDYPLCTAAGSQTDPAAYGDRVVWVDQRANPSGWAGDIWMYDYSTGEEIQITDDEYEQSDPDLWGDWVVFTDMRYGNTDVRAKNVVTGEDLWVCTDLSSQQRPKISDDIIVWEDYRNGEWDVFAYRIGSGTQTCLTEFDGGDARSPDVFAVPAGRTVAWEVGGRLVMRNIDEVVTITPMEGIYGATLVAGDDEFVWGRFEDRESTGENRLYLYGIGWSTGGVFEIPTTYEPYAEFRSMSVSGTKVAYATSTDTGFRTQVHDWVAETEVAVSGAASGQHNPAIAGDMVVWRDDRNWPGSGDDYYDLYTNREVVPPGPVGATITTTSTSRTLAAYGDAYTLTGTLEHDGEPLEGKTVVLQKATKATGTFADTTVTATTAADGTFSLSHVPVSKTYYQASFAGDDSYTAATGTVTYALPRAFVGKPVAPSVMYVGKAKIVYGYLKPRHTAGTTPVRIYKWRYVGGTWKASGYVKAKASNYAGYTKYTKSLSLPAKDKWRLRAYHPADAGHAASWSQGYEYVTVK